MNRERLPLPSNLKCSIPFAERETALPPVAAVYFILDRAGDPLYIGSTTFLDSRFWDYELSHYLADAVRITWLPMDIRDGYLTLRLMERMYIRAYCPPLNKIRYTDGAILDEEGIFIARGVSYATIAAAGKLLGLDCQQMCRLVAAQQIKSETVLGVNLEVIRLSTIREYQSTRKGKLRGIIYLTPSPDLW